MYSMADEELSRVAKSLSADYNSIQGDETPHLRRHSSRSSSMHSEVLDVISCEYEKAAFCTIPALSLKWNHSYNNKSQAQQHTGTGIFTSRSHECSQLLSRTIQFRRKQLVSYAPLVILKNLIHSFGITLEVQLQRLLYSMAKSQNRQQKGRSASMAKSSRDDFLSNEDLYEKFSSLRESSTSSLVTPMFAWTSFSTMLPVTEWSQTDDGHDKVVMPLLFQAEIAVMLPNKVSVTICLETPGQICGFFTRDNGGRPQSIHVDMDTKYLYNLMRQKCALTAKTIVKTVLGSDVTLPKLEDKFCTLDSSCQIPTVNNNYNNTNTLSNDSRQQRTNDEIEEKPERQSSQQESPHIPSSDSASMILTKIQQTKNFGTALTTDTEYTDSTTPSRKGTESDITSDDCHTEEPLPARPKQKRWKRMFRPSKQKETFQTKSQKQ